MKRIQRLIAMPKSAKPKVRMSLGPSPILKETRNGMIPLKSVSPTFIKSSVLINRNAPKSDAKKYYLSDSNEYPEGSVNSHSLSFGAKLARGSSVLFNSSSSVLQKNASHPATKSTHDYKEIIHSNKISNKNKNNFQSHTIKIRLESNWGHPSLISCSKIEVLGANRVPIEINKISIEPKMVVTNMSDLNENMLTKLINGQLIKQENTDCWSAKWPPEKPLNFLDIILNIELPEYESEEKEEFETQTLTNKLEEIDENDELNDVVKINNKPTSQNNTQNDRKVIYNQIDSLRIWPVSSEPTQNFRKVTIYYNNYVLFDDELQKDFGSNIPLQLYDESGNCLIKRIYNDAKQKIVDDFGQLPYRPTQCLEICFLKSYNHNSKFGLQRIRLYDNEGNELRINDQVVIEAVECGEFTSRSSSDSNNASTQLAGNIHQKSIKDLFYDPIEAKNKGLKMTAWEGDLTPNSRLVIKFTEPIVVSAVLFITLKKIIGPSDIALKQVKIKNNGVNVWCGKLKRCNEYPEDERSLATVAFLHDHEKIRKAVLNDAFQEPPLTYRPVDY
ncbi:hypothetical protein TRFO_42426 [Tritrichomonas foetus]|uniref:KATNIP domain-containing protein n=1 Tax=Tritrichomonas foetus TaxID=1144522 RepID=A0A1J4KWF2_9EUKA|nr:hypothetical protein TRFO_42426 [Tritrichomonas foetus]|eukprot:OHT15609.1 hypothetical protein TRFO_42426 [Tritrichomonas foetus]